MSFVNNGFNLMLNDEEDHNNIVIPITDVEEDEDNNDNVVEVAEAMVYPGSTVPPITTSAIRTYRLEELSSNMIEEMASRPIASLYDTADNDSLNITHIQKIEEMLNSSHYDTPMRTSILHAFLEVHGINFGALPLPNVGLPTAYIPEDVQNNIIGYTLNSENSYS